MAEDKQTPEEEVVEETVETPDVDTDATADVDPIVALETKIAEAEEKIAEAEDKYLRAHAEMQNIQRRANEERQSLQRYRSQDLAKKILPSLDNLERALQVEGLTEDVKKGIEMVRESLIQALQEEGVEEVEVESFDPNLHMAVQTVPADDEHPADSIVQVFQKGYQLHERLLRPAMVVVAQ